MPVSRARELARQSNFDLVEVAPKAEPPVCRLMDYGKYKYEQAKKEREIKKNQRISLLRQVRLRPKIGSHDLEAKRRSVRKLLDNGDKVMVSVFFRGREVTHPELGWRLLQDVAESLKGIATLDKQPTLDGKRMTMILAPIAKAKVKEEAGKT